MYFYKIVNYYVFVVYKTYSTNIYFYENAKQKLMINSY